MLQNPRLLIVTIPLLGLAVAGCSAKPAPTSDRSGAASSVNSAAAAGASSASSPKASGSAASTSATPSVTGSGTLIVPTSAAAAGSAGSAGPGPAASPAAAGASSRDPISIDDCGDKNPAGLSVADAQKLRAGGTAGGLQLVYPYEGTVFPRGLVAPDVMWQGASADAVFVHIQSKAFEYSGCLRPTAEGRIALDQHVWDEAGQRTYGKDDIYRLELSTLKGGTVTGPVKRGFVIAQATIKGSIYYNSYNSMLAPTGAANGGGRRGGMTGGIVLRIPAGGKAELFGETSCNGCHALSADGSTLLSQFVGVGAESYQIQAGGAAGTPVAAGQRGAFGALYPDGSVYLSGSSAVEVARANMTSQGAIADATLHDTKTGQVVRNTGIPAGALMPMFSPDGTRLVFNDFALDEAHGLALMQYDVAKHTASDYAELMREPAGGAMRPGWPFVLPDNHAVVFARTDGQDFSGNGAGIVATNGGGRGGQGANGAAPFSELSIVDVASHNVTVLAKAMGYDSPADAASGKTYLPFGAEELHHNYFPTVSPVAAGGYFWLFFDSVRHYGVLGSGRQLWGAAIDIAPDGSYKLDPSHPAFYLPGQELGTGNHRAFAALDPCRKDGDSCTSGIDCCGGTCYIENQAELTEPVGMCMPRKMMECAKRDERCSHDSDCCLPLPGEQRNLCIGGFCAFVAPPS